MNFRACEFNAEADHKKQAHRWIPHNFQRFLQFFRTNCLYSERYKLCFKVAQMWSWWWVHLFFFFPSASSSSFFQAVTLAKHTAPVSLAASVFTIGFLMLTTTAFFMVDTSDWFVSNRGEIVCILYSVCVLISLSFAFNSQRDLFTFCHLEKSW